ncbi:hypothetical protein BR93DRAFT_346029 [Coniochaeta sp. PMI_546]|nr:hypothetical protein BR93DRAFT_346029 [Coniochaeta sp. PMI_546]
MRELPEIRNSSLVKVITMSWHSPNPKFICESCTESVSHAIVSGMCDGKIFARCAPLGFDDSPMPLNSYTVAPEHNRSEIIRHLLELMKEACPRHPHIRERCWHITMLSSVGTYVDFQGFQIVVFKGSVTLTEAELIARRCWAIANHCR